MSSCLLLCLCRGSGALTGRAVVGRPGVLPCPQGGNTTVIPPSSYLLQPLLYHQGKPLYHPQSLNLIGEHIQDRCATTIHVQPTLLIHIRGRLE